MEIHRWNCRVFERVVYKHSYRLSVCERTNQAMTSCMSYCDKVNWTSLYLEVKALSLFLSHSHRPTFLWWEKYDGCIPMSLWHSCKTTGLQQPAKPFLFFTCILRNILAVSSVPSSGLFLGRCVAVCLLWLLPSISNSCILYPTCHQQLCELQKCPPKGDSNQRKTIIWAVFSAKS